MTAFMCTRKAGNFQAKVWFDNNLVEFSVDQTGGLQSSPLIQERLLG